MKTCIQTWVFWFFSHLASDGTMPLGLEMESRLTLCLSWK